MQKEPNLYMRVLKPVAAALASLWVALLVGTAASAFAGPVYYWTVGPALGDLDCTPGNLAYAKHEYISPIVTYSEYQYTITNLRTGSSTSYYDDYGPSNGGNVVVKVVDWYVPIPAGTQPGDVLVHEFWWIIDGVYAVTNSPIAWVCDTGEIVFPDGRINDDAIAGPVALYCDGDTLEVWTIDADGVGSLAFSYSSWPANAPASNTKLAGAGSSSLWQLDSGEFQVNANAGEGKIYAFVFNGCPYDGGGYNANLDPNE